MLRNTLVYYLLNFAPLVVLFVGMYAGGMDATVFIVLLLTYSLVYRSLLDGMRLVQKGVINQKEIFQLFIPFRRVRYFRELYFG